MHSTRLCWLALAILCASSIRLSAQAGQIDGIAHVAYRVGDLDRELAFLQKLGYEESFRLTANGKTSEVFVKINDRQFFELYPQTDPSQPLGWMHVCYESADIAALVPALAARGLNPRPVSKAGAGNLISSLRDPEDRTTEFTQYMPGSRHTLDKGLHLGLNRISSELIGFVLPVSHFDAQRQFYRNLGFDLKESKDGFQAAAPGNAGLRIELNLTHPGDQPQTLFAVPDARKAADRLHSLGIDASRRKKTVLVRDPDGNPLVFMETAAHR